MGKHSRVTCFFGLLVAVLTSVRVLAADEPSGHNPKWFAQPYAYVLVEQDVRAAMEEFGHNLGLIVVMSDKVRGKSRSRVRGESAGDFLNQLCDSNGLTWYFDGNILYLSANAETSTRLFKAQGQNLEQLDGYLAGLEVYGKQISTHTGPDGDELFVSGPPPYLSMVEQHLNHQQRPVGAPAAREHGVRVFRGGAITTQTSN